MSKIDWISLPSPNDLLIMEAKQGDIDMQKQGKGVKEFFHPLSFEIEKGALFRFKATFDKKIICVLDLKEYITYRENNLGKASEGRQRMLMKKVGNLIYIIGNNCYRFLAVLSNLLDKYVVKFSR